MVLCACDLVQKAKKRVFKLVGGWVFRPKWPDSLAAGNAG